MESISGLTNWRLNVRRDDNGVTILRALTCDKKAVLPDELFGLYKYDGTFWVGYAMITAAFLIHLACASILLREDRAQRIFYKMPLVRVTYIGLILMLVFWLSEIAACFYA